MIDGQINPEQTETRSVASKGWGSQEKEKHELRGYHVVLIRHNIIALGIYFQATFRLTSAVPIMPLEQKYCGVSMYFLGGKDALGPLLELVGSRSLRSG